MVNFKRNAREFKRTEREVIAEEIILQFASNCLNVKPIAGINQNTVNL